MFIKFKPAISYLKHSSEYLAINVYGEKYYYKFSTAYHFDFSTLQFFIPAESILPEILSFLTKENLTIVRKDLGCYDTKNEDSLLSALAAEAQDDVELTTLLLQQNVTIHNFTNIKINLDEISHYFGGLQLAENLPDWQSETSLNILFCHDDSSDNLLALNEKFHALRQPWLLILLKSKYLQIGPFYNSTILRYCHFCYLRRIASKDPLSELLAAPDPLVSEIFFHQVLKGFINLEILKAFASDFKEYQRSVLFHSPVYTKTIRTNFIAYPFCEVCSET